jgi:hypothetical protein
MMYWWYVEGHQDDKIMRMNAKGETAQEVCDKFEVHYPTAIISEVEVLYAFKNAKKGAK